MTARWDAAVAAYKRESWLGRTLVVLSVDVALAVADDLGLDRARLAEVQPSIRAILGPAVGARIAAPLSRLPAERLLPALDSPARAFVLTYYDRVMRFSLAEDVALFCWGTTLMRFVADEALWASLGLAKDDSERLRKEFWASMETTDIQERLDEAFAKPLSDWDRRIAVAQLMPPEDEGAPGIGDQELGQAAKVVRRLSFWRLAGELLGEPGLDLLRARCQAFLETQPDIAPAFGQLYDPHLLAHPENTAGDPLHPV